MPLSVGDKLPTDVKFTYVPYTEEKAGITSCGSPIVYNAGIVHFTSSHFFLGRNSGYSNTQTQADGYLNVEWQNKKVVLFSVPGAFTPGCSAKHLPGFIENLDKLKAKGVDIVACIAYNDAFVMNAWAKANEIRNDDILFLSDDKGFSKDTVGWMKGERTARYALVIDQGVVKYAEVEPGMDVDVSSATAVLAKL
ncbi:hypothetical protein HYALB_00008593 [Hymenoscyphus albidus]|uniref:Thioredoxin domain-containing protein n=1 Tax=Hymenoscyphus albidus TaxID=595503 RepID=A0A9N9Q2K6_9HELO|nr:hypothetical protein HYALB_00008593 [Hymenoscyphus albidus]